MKSIRCKQCGYLLREEAMERRHCYACLPMTTEEYESALHPDMRKFRTKEGKKNGISES